MVSDLDCVNCHINTLRSRQNGRHFADDIIKCVFLNENIWISMNISLRFVSLGQIKNIPALGRIMAWHRRGNKPLSEPMMVNLLTHICVTRSQWVTPYCYKTQTPFESFLAIWIWVYVRVAYVCVRTYSLYAYYMYTKYILYLYMCVSKLCICACIYKYMFMGTYIECKIYIELSGDRKIIIRPF